MKLMEKCAVVGMSILLTSVMPMSALASPSFSDLFSFGDSLSDVGNVFVATAVSQPQPASPYANGQYSNGPIWIQGLSAGLGLGVQVPSLLGGNGYAFGGATTANASTTSTEVPNLAQQVASFSRDHGGLAPSSALYTVWAGSNDIVNILAETADPACATNPSSCVSDAALAEANDIRTLASLGARRFLIPFVPDLGATPLLIGAGAVAQQGATALASVYNSTLQASLNDLMTGTPGVDLRYLDVFNILDAAIGDPAAFGLSNVTDPCYVGAETGGGIVCATPNQYLFWDQVHPTAVAHAFIAQAALAEVPEPGTPFAIVIGLLAMGAVPYCLRRVVLQNKPSVT